MESEINKTMKDNILNNKNNEFRILDPIKIKMAWLDKFMKDYGVKENATYKERLERLELLSKDKNTPESDKKDMTKILKTLGKIANCNLCHQEINWDKQEGLYNINPTETARHETCHEKAEKVKNHGK